MVTNAYQETVLEPINFGCPTLTACALLQQRCGDEMSDKRPSCRAGSHSFSLARSSLLSFVPTFQKPSYLRIASIRFSLFAIASELYCDTLLYAIATFASEPLCKLPCDTRPNCSRLLTIVRRCLDHVPVSSDLIGEKLRLGTMNRNFFYPSVRTVRST